MIRAARLVVGAACLASLVGCSAEAQTPAGSTPALRAALTKIDDALVHGNYAGARRDLVLLVQEVRRERATHELSATGATDIVAAARSLLSQLPHASVNSPTTTMTVQPSASIRPQATATPSHHPTTSPHQVPTAAPQSAAPSATTPSTPAPSAPPTAQATPTANSSPASARTP